MFTLKYAVLLLFTAASIVAALVLCGKFIKADEGRKRVFIAIIIFNSVTELLKLINDIIPASFSAIGAPYLPGYALPFYLCSMFLWAIPVAVFAKGKFKGPARAFVVFYGLFSGFAPFLVPDMILGDPNAWTPFLAQTILPLRSFLYHGSLIFCAVYLGTAGWFKPDIKRCFYASAMMAAILVLTLLLNLYTGTSFTNITLSADNLPLFIGLIETMGFVPFCLLIIVTLCLVPFIFYAVFLLVKKIAAAVKGTRMDKADTVGQ
ncbi:MAG: YwaF family protein [Firmicutes bacterium]|nr:YwaF family protein [Bacillota bacterium]